MQYMFCITALYLLKVCHIQFAYSSLHVDIFAGFRNIRQDTADQQRPERAQTLTSKSALCCTIGISTCPLFTKWRLSFFIQSNALKNIIYTTSPQRKQRIHADDKSIPMFLLNPTLFSTHPVLFSASILVPPVLEKRLLLLNRQFIPPCPRSLCLAGHYVAALVKKRARAAQARALFSALETLIDRTV